MTNERFEELVNLYLDAEIGRRELDELKRTVGENVMRRQQFERACQLHQAARKALVAQVHGGRGGDEAEAEGGHEDPGDAPAASSRSHRSRHRSRPRDGSQRRAHINASVSTMVERQASKGIAATVRLDEVKRSSSGGKRPGSSSAGHSGKPSAQPAAGSPVGWIIGALGLGTALLASLVLVNPESEKTKFGGNDAASFAVGERPSIPDKLPGFSKDGELETINGDEAFRARMLAVALAGNSVSRQFQVNILAARPEPVAETGATAVLAVGVTQGAVLAPGSASLPAPGAPPWAPAAGGPELLPIPPMQATSAPSGALAVPPAPAAGQPGEILQKPPTLIPPPTPLPGSVFETPPPTTVSPLAEP